MMTACAAAYRATVPKQETYVLLFSSCEIYEPNQLCASRAHVYNHNNHEFCVTNFARHLSTLALPRCENQTT